jgi:hypothetical protein
MDTTFDQADKIQDAVYRSRLTGVAFQSTGLIPRSFTLKAADGPSPVYEVTFSFALSKTQREAFQNAVKNAVDAECKPLGIQVVVAKACEPTA